MVRPFGVNKEASLLRDVVFGANDGVVTTFAVIAGSLGGGLTTKTVIVLGFANLVADGFSMASGIYLGAKSEVDLEKKMKNKHWREDVPLVQGIATFIAFACGGLVPLLPFVLGLPNQVFLSGEFMFAFLFLVGMARSIFTGKNAIRSGIEMLLVGGLAAAFAYGAGHFVEKIFF